MTRDRQDHPSLESGVGALEQILNSELGDPAPVESYHRPLSAELSKSLEAKLDDVERAQAEAAARLPNLYAD